MSTVTAGTLRIDEYGDAALLIGSSAPTREAQWAAMQTIGIRLRGAHLPGIESVVATFDSLLVTFDPLAADADHLTSWIVEHGQGDGAVLDTGRTHRIPVLYGGDGGPDLEAVAAELEITVADFVEQHAGTRWRVAFNGAPGGAPLHEGSPFDRPIPRMPEPRVRIPVGTVAVSGHQGTFYTIPSPGGWRCIGRTPLRIVDPDGDRFVAIEPGDGLRFHPVSEREFTETPARFIGEVEPDTEPVHGDGVLR